MFDDDTLQSIGRAEQGDEELFALIAERERQFAIGDEIEARAFALRRQIDEELPSAQCEVGRMVFKSGAWPIIAKDEEHLNQLLSDMTAVLLAIERVALKHDPGPFCRLELHKGRRDDLIAELRSRKAALDDAYAAAGIAGLHEEAGGHHEAAGEMWDRIVAYTPLTLRGAAALIEQVVDQKAGEIMDSEAFARALAVLCQGAEP